jgi:hypothetical protein
LLASKQFANLRLKLGKKKQGDPMGKTMKMPILSGMSEVESIPSNIDTNQWGEIMNYNH